MDVIKKNTPQQQQTMNKKFNQGQRTRKVQYFKKKHRRLNKQTKKMPNNKHFSLADTTPLVELQELSISEHSSTKKKKKFEYSDITSNSDPTLLLSDYSIVSNENFKQILLTTLSKTTTEGIDRNALIELLNNEEILAFTRQLTQLVNKLKYYKLQNEQWTYYYNLGMTKGIWTGRVSKKMADVNSMCYTYGRSKILIGQRQKTYKQQLEQIQSDINQYMKQATVALIQMTQIMNSVNNLIDQDQYQLRIELQRRRHMLEFDAKEQQLVNDFYQLKPRQTEIHSAKIIWKAIQDEQAIRYEIAMFKQWLSIQQSQPTSSSLFPDLKLTNINHIFTQLAFQTQSTSINDLAHQTLSKVEEMVQAFQQTIIEEKNKLLKTRWNHKNISLFDKIMTTILSRETNMIDRAQYDIEHKLLIALNRR